MDTIEKSKKPIVLYLGFILTISSLLIFLILNQINKYHSNTDENGFYLINYLIALVYFVVIIIKSIIDNRWKFLRKIDRRHVNLSIILLSISSFSINKTINIFSDFPIWLKVSLFLTYIPLLIYCLPKKYKNKLNYLAAFLTGIGLVLTLYFTVFLIPTYAIGLIGLILLGITSTLFAPGLTFATLIVQYLKEKLNLKHNILLISGIIIPLVITVIFLGKYKTINKQIHTARATEITRPQNDLPEWVILSQNLSETKFTEKIIKGNLVYDKGMSVWNGWAPLNNSFSENRLHDPLMVIAQTFVKDINLSNEERINILKLREDNRHLAHRKLWSGDDLSTTNVITNVDIYPSYRFAYLEKYITVKNNANWDWSQQEALYTFYLPEGAIVTSMSLWINGNEEKSRLTTKEKADSAYATIVGKEQRDPALLHWQEGNTVTLTIFPCTPKEERKIKVGFTVPLQKDNENLTLTNIYFNGPYAKDALETTIIRFPKASIPVSNLKGFKLLAMDNCFKYEGKYREEWNIKIPKTECSKNVFTHNGYQYSINDYTPEKSTSHFSPEIIYLDINKSWTQTEYAEILDLYKDKAILAHKDSFIKINENNKDAVFNELSKLNYSLFPFYKINNPSKSLVISKSPSISPRLYDLSNSRFSEKLSDYFRNTKDKIAFFSLNKINIPYLETINQFNLINYDYGDLDLLKKYAQNEIFQKANDNPDRIILYNSKLEILRKKGDSKSTAPDHLYRLFGYKKILDKTAGNYFEKDTYITDELLSIAKDAYVVSPVSSLIILETQNDYTRFDIKENENGLQNAYSESTGGVPEPHEWALIILISLLLIGLIIRQKLSNSFNLR